MPSFKITGLKSSGEDFLKVFTIHERFLKVIPYMGVAAILVM